MRESCWFETRPSRRLTRFDRSKELFPWQRAAELDNCALYWMPSACPFRMQEHAWITSFLHRLERLLEGKRDLHPYVFIRYKTLMHLSDAERVAMLDFLPRIGLLRRPGDDNSPLGEPANISQMEECTPDFCYWFIDRNEE